MARVGGVCGGTAQETDLLFQRRSASPSDRNIRQKRAVWNKKNVLYSAFSHQ